MMILLLSIFCLSLAILPEYNAANRLAKTLHVQCLWRLLLWIERHFANPVSNTALCRSGRGTIGWKTASWCVQIDEMEKAGWGGFFMHSRLGLKTPYMTPEWMDRIRTCVEEARGAACTPGSMMKTSGRAALRVA